MGHLLLTLVQSSILWRWLLEEGYTPKDWQLLFFQVKENTDIDMKIISSGGQYTTAPLQSVEHDLVICIYCCCLSSLSLSFPSFLSFFFSLSVFLPSPSLPPFLPSMNFFNICVCKKLCLLFPFFLKLALLRYNAHTIPFTHLIYIIQWFLLYSLSCVCNTTINFQPFLSPQK